MSTILTPSRRGFLGALLVAGAAPAIVRASSLMQLPPPPRIIRPGYPMGMVSHYCPSLKAMEVRIFSDAGWLTCDGREVSRALLPGLAAVLPPTMVAATPGTFRLPDLRHHFVHFAA